MHFICIKTSRPIPIQGQTQTKEVWLDTSKLKTPTVVESPRCNMDLA